MHVFNRKAVRDYFLLENFEAGIELTGPEVKSVKKGQIKLENSFIKIKGREVFLLNAHISAYKFADQRNYEPLRPRRLLLHKREILSLAAKIKQKKLTLVPLSCYTKDGWVKLKIALAKGKKKYEKRASEKRRDLRKRERKLRG